MKNFTLAFLQLRNDAFDLLGDSLQLSLQAREVSLLLQRHRSQVTIEPSGRIANSDAQLIDGMMKTTRQRKAQKQSAQGRAQPHKQQHPLEGAHDPTVFLVRFCLLSLVESPKQDCRLQDIFFELLSHQSILTLGFFSYLQGALIPP